MVLPQRLSMSNAPRVLVSNLVLAALCLWGTAWPSLQKTAVRTRVLFIGNSLTTANDLPGLVAALFVAAGGQTIECRTVAFAGYSLEDHWEPRRRAARDRVGRVVNRRAAAGTVGAAGIAGPAA